ncbi:hypothetical protein EC957_009148 [Mortierella hygrophila]|uniref:Uncharacterized protein n=1 Tax=Mortierella hygrophila TaxID=979708 RepID=A0A9P6EWM9_9FUNG|nr:hypothetical protein EC957_009148 [Mortierella hygrophila]
MVRGDRPNLPTQSLFGDYKPDQDRVVMDFLNARMNVNKKKASLDPSYLRMFGEDELAERKEQEAEFHKNSEESRATLEPMEGSAVKSAKSMEETRSALHDLSAVMQKEAKAAQARRLVEREALGLEEARRKAEESRRALEDAERARKDAELKEKSMELDQRQQILTKVAVDALEAVQGSEAERAGRLYGETASTGQLKNAIAVHMPNPNTGNHVRFTNPDDDMDVDSVESTSSSLPKRAGESLPQSTKRPKGTSNSSSSSGTGSSSSGTGSSTSGSSSGVKDKDGKKTTK